MEEIKQNLSFTSVQEVSVENKQPKTKKSGKNKGTWLNSQKLRWSVQIAFFIVVLVIGWQFYTFVKYCEAGGKGFYMPRPPGVESFLPISALMGTKYFFRHRSNQYYSSCGFCYLWYTASNGHIFQEGFLRLDLPYWYCF